MKARLMIENPDEVEATIKLTMSLKQWDELRSQLDNKFPSLRLSMVITDLLSQGRRVFYAADPEEA